MTIPNRHGDLSTPSVVLFEDDGLIVGKEAQRLALLEPERVAECAKRDMGSPYYHRPVAGRQIPPQVISAIILKRLKADAERRVGPIRRVVITVPAYFDHTRREATCEAARLAGPGGRRPPQRADRRGAGLRVPGRLSRRGRDARRAERPSARA